MQYKKDYDPQQILPHNCLRDLQRCLNFIKNFEETCMPDNNHKLMELLDEVSDILYAMKEALGVYAFLGQVQMCSYATNDNDILDHSDALETQLQQYRMIADNVERIHERLVRAISSKYS